VPAGSGISPNTHRGRALGPTSSFYLTKEDQVTNGQFPVSSSSLGFDRSGRAPLALHARTRLQRERLDAELAHGADPAADERLELRAAQLRSHPVRAELANALVEAVGDARGPNLGPFRPEARRRDAAVREAADDIAALVAKLRGDGAVTVQGAAMAARLVNDRRSPLNRHRGHELPIAIRAAHAALDGAVPRVEEWPSAA
jgi:hypothetical protein